MKYQIVHYPNFPRPNYTVEVEPHVLVKCDGGYYWYTAEEAEKALQREKDSHKREVVKLLDVGEEQ